MSQAIRQSDLFTGNDWQVIYRAFTNINFNASDPPSINRALREYIQQNYPENFNDWIESSEFVAIIDLISWIAGTLAFKTDINARESFLETAQQRDSILRLARFISYNPSRNQCGQGLVKLVRISTNDDVYDGYGNNLNSQTISWDNPDDPDWFERFIIILNSASISTAPFGVPLKNGTVGGVKTQSYRLNNTISDARLSFNASIGGNSMPFEIVNCDFDSGGGIYERSPDYFDALSFLYRNDGNGNASPNTGFFLMFKQGTLSNTDFNIPIPVENNVLSIPVTGVNDTDVWVQSVNDSGNILYSWNKVPAIFSENITYNNYDPSMRSIFSVITGKNDTISVRFSDGRFGAVPTGNIRVWHRTSNGLSYQIRPTDMNLVRITIPYYNRANVKRNLTLTFSLQETLSNSVPAETNEQIQARAPSVYATQNRMVSGQDYNIFPLQSTAALKVKALNRVYSGHSRFIDLNDPTGNYQGVNVFADDGIFFKENYKIYSEVPTTFTSVANDIISLYLQTTVNRPEVRNFGNDTILRVSNITPSGITWKRATTDDSFITTGYFHSLTELTSYIVPGATILFSIGSKIEWATIVNITGNATLAPTPGSPGPVVLSLPITDGASIIKILPALNTNFDSSAYDALINNIKSPKQSDIWYDYSSQLWIINPTLDGSGNPPKESMFLVAKLIYNHGSWCIESEGTRYVFESLRDVKWYNDGRKTTDQKTGTAANDSIKILKINENLNDFAPVGNSFVRTGRGLQSDYDLSVDRIYLNRDGSPNPLRTTVMLSDTNYDGYADFPDTFYRIIASPAPGETSIIPEQYLFWKHDVTYGDVPLSNSVYLYEDSIQLHSSTPPNGTIGFQIDSPNPLLRNTFWVYSNSNWSGPQRIGTYSFGIGRGPNIAVKFFPRGLVDINSNIASIALNPQPPISFQWKHYASNDHRIDPARTNINDIFILTSGYDYLVRLWIANGSDPNTIPTPPTELELRLAFENFEDYRMFSDQIVWRPASYKFLFGVGADDQVRGQFKVVLLPNTTLSDGEVSSEVVRAINTYFTAAYWDFGETFYFTELAAYIHQQLSNVISSIVFVPTYSNSNFGDGFEITCRPDQIFISTAQVSDIVIIKANTPSNLRIR